MGNIMKTFALVLSVSIALGVVCSSAHANYGRSALQEAARLSNAETTELLFISAFVSAYAISESALQEAALSSSLAGPTSVGRVESVSVFAPMSAPINRIEKFKNNFAEYVQLQRAMVLRQLGLPLHNLLAGDHDFRDTVLMKAMRIEGYDDTSYISGDELIDTGLEKYLPSVYELSAENVLDSAEAFDDFGNPTQTGRWSNEKIFNFKSVVSLIDSSLGDTGRRDIIDNLNKLDFDAADEFLRKFSFSWNLRILQAGSDLELARETGGAKSESASYQVAKDHRGQATQA